MCDERTQWHPAFCSAMRLELIENKGDLTFLQEFGLNTKPIKIDLLVIKKLPYVHIHNEIGSFFKGHNIIEYKSPGYELNIDVFYKVFAYACIYKSMGATVDEIRDDDITITFIRREKPMKLFMMLKDRGMDIRQTADGIYRISNKLAFDIQVIVSKELDKGAHTWITSLTNDLTIQDARTILQEAIKLTDKDDKEYADSVLEVAVSQNRFTFNEAKEVDKMCRAMLDLMKPEIDVIINSAVAAKDAELNAKDAALEAKDAELKAQNAYVKELEAQLSALGVDIKSKF